MIDSKTILFLDELADHIRLIDGRCDHCINGFLEFGEFDADSEQYKGGVNKLLNKHFPGLRYEHTRGKGIKNPSTVCLVVDND